MNAIGMFCILVKKQILLFSLWDVPKSSWLSSNFTGQNEISKQLFLHPYNSHHDRNTNLNGNWCVNINVFIRCMK